jgi:hypothetical protein
MNIGWRGNYEYKLERVGLRFNFRVNVRGMGKKGNGKGQDLKLGLGLGLVPNVLYFIIYL